MKKFKWLVPTLYIVFLMLPIYWLINMSFKTTTEIINTYSLWPREFTTENYVKIFTDSTWYMGYVNSITYTVFNTVISVAAALPAAYAFSRYKFLGQLIISALAIYVLIEYSNHEFLFDLYFPFFKNLILSEKELIFFRIISSLTW